jgi:thiamine pyrophosphate-dependent acetolactate synthase large subunit-like protein
MATATAAAKTDGSPLLVMTGEVPIEMQGRGEFQDASQATLDDTAVMGPLTRLSKTVLGAKNLNHWFRHALTTMWAQPRGPVHLSLAHDALIGESAVNYVKVHPFFVGTEPLSLAPADAALAALASVASGQRGKSYCARIARRKTRVNALMTLALNRARRHAPHWRMRSARIPTSPFSPAPASSTAPPPRC